MSEDIIREDLEELFHRKIDYMRFDGKTVLITGAYGMLASYLVYMLAFLNEKGLHVRVLALVRSKDKFNLKFGEDFTKRYPVEVIESDLHQPIEITEPIHFIIHAASMASPDKYVKYPVEVIEPNMIGTYHLLSLAKQKNTEGFLLFSTGDVYGEVDIPERITEETNGRLNPLDPHSCYGESKRMAEALCCAFYREYGVPTVSARISHTYGPTMDTEHDPRVFASMLKCALDGTDIIMQSDGSAYRAFCYLADATAAFITLLLKGTPGEAYNVSNTDEFMSIRTFAEIVAGLRDDAKCKVVCRERPKDDNYLENHINRGNLLINDKLRELGWSAKYTTREGMMRTLTYLRNARRK